MSLTSKTQLAFPGLWSVWREIHQIKLNILNVFVRSDEWSFCVPLLQMLVYLFYALPLLTVFIYGLKTPGCTWMLDWTIFFAGAMSQVTVTSLLLLIFLEKAKYSIKLTSSCCSLRPSGAISEHLCTPALPSRTESQQTNGGLLSPSMCCWLLCRLFWPYAAALTPLILWNLFPRDRATTRRRKTRPHTSHRLSRNTSRCDKANVFWGLSLAHKLH